MLRICRFLFVLPLLAAVACDDAGEQADSLSLENAASEEKANGNTYLDEALRKRVEKLKDAVRSNPTTAANVRERARILLDWSNARATAGLFLPHDITLLTGTFLVFAQEQLESLSSPASPERLDKYVAEMTLLDEQPDALGPLSVDRLGPFPAGEYATLTFTYKVGSLPIEPGGGFLIAAHGGADFEPFQTDDPTAPNYLAIGASNFNVGFVADKAQMTGTFAGGVFGKQKTLFFRVTGQTLKSGDTVTIIYGDKSGGSPGLRMPSYSNERTPFGIFIDPDGSGQTLSLPLLPIRMVGAQTAGVHGFAPSIVKIGESITVSVRSEDKWRNRASGSIPAYDVFLNGQRYSAIEAGDNPITLLKDIRFTRPGIYRFSFRSKDGGVLGDANPILVESNPATRIYWGETHGHTGYAEGIGTAEGFMAFAHDDARLDFVMHSEHDIMMDDSEWATMLKVARDYHKEGEFLAFMGYEWTVDTSQGGHHNVMFRTPEGRKPTKSVDAPVLSALYQGLRTQNDPKDVLVIPHAHRAGDWRMSDPDLEHLVEVMSMHGTFEWFGRMYIKNGHRVGFVAASDDHKSHPGYSAPTPAGLQQPGGLAAVLAPEKTSEVVFNALKARTAYGTTGERIILTVSVNGAAMGSAVEFSPKRKIEGRVIGTAPLESVTLVKNGEEVASNDLLGDSTGGSSRFQLMFTSPSNPPGFIFDNPRGYRPWVGSVKIEGARLVTASMPSLRNNRTEYVRVDEADPNLVHVSAHTRGGIRTFEFELADITPNARLLVSLNAGKERPTAPSLYRKAAELAPANLRFPLKSMTGEGMTEKLPLNVQGEPFNAGYEDIVRVRRIRERPLMDSEFSFTETDAYRPGDTYYVRVVQSDGAIAWSSPVWVGGVPPR